MELPLSTRVRQGGGAPLVRAAALCAAAGLALLATLADPQAARAAPAVWITVSPSTVSAGMQVGISASCGDTATSASATSGAFASPVSLAPVNGVLSGTTSVPEATPAKGYTVTLICPSGNTATTTLWVITNTAPSQGPATGGGGRHPGGAILAIGVAAITTAGVLGVASRRRRRESIRL